MDLKGIVKGVSNRAISRMGFLPGETEQIAQERLKICQGDSVTPKCDIYDETLDKCVKAKGGCGCTMKNKVYCMECECPKKKWLPKI